MHQQIASLAPQGATLRRWTRYSAHKSVESDNWYIFCLLQERLARTLDC